MRVSLESKQSYLRVRYNAYVGLVVFFLAEFYFTVCKSEECVVFTYTYVLTSIVFCTTLTYDNVSCDCFLTTKNFDTQALTC